MRGFLALLITIVALSCTPQYRGGGVPPEGDNPYIISIAALKSLYVGGSQRVGEVVFISGDVTATNHTGEYINTLIIEDETGAVEVSVDVAYDIYKVGCLLTLNCTDLWMGSEGGALVLGGEPSDEYIVGRLDGDEFLSRAKICGSVVRDPRPLTFDQFSRDLVSCYISLNGVRFLPSVDGDGVVVDTFCAVDPVTGRRITTMHTIEEVATGERISLYVPSSVDYAADPLPSGEGMIYAILSRYGDRYSVSLTSRGHYF